MISQRSPRSARSNPWRLPGEAYKLALTPGLLSIFQAKASAADLTALLTGSEGKYRDLDGDGRLWIPSGRAFYSPNSSDSAAQELAFAKMHFFNPHRFQDPFGNVATVGYDAKYDLAVVSALDPVGNVTTAEPDFRVLRASNGDRPERKSRGSPLRRPRYAGGHRTARQGNRAGRRRFLRQFRDRPLAGRDHRLFRLKRPGSARCRDARHGHDTHRLRSRPCPRLRGIDRPRNTCK